MFFWWNVGVWQPKFMGNFPTMLHSVRTYSSAIAGSTRILEESWSIMEAHWSAYAALLPPWWLPQRRPSWRCVGWPRVRLHSNHKLCRWRADQGSLREDQPVATVEGFEEGWLELGAVEPPLPLQQHPRCWQERMHRSSVSSLVNTLLCC